MIFCLNFFIISHVFVSLTNCLLVIIAAIFLPIQFEFDKHPFNL